MILEDNERKYRLHRKKRFLDLTLRLLLRK